MNNLILLTDSLGNTKRYNYEFYDNGQLKKLNTLELPLKN